MMSNSYKNVDIAELETIEMRIHQTIYKRTTMEYVGRAVPTFQQM